MAVAGALIGGAIGAFGEKPKIPQLQDINPDLVQAQTTKGNLANFGDIAKLVTQVNTLNQDQLNALIDRALPGARDQIAKNISSQLRGEVPEDVSRAITRYNAGRNVGALTQGSGFSAGVAAKDLGLTSLNLIDKGLSSAESWLQRSTAPQMDATSMFFTPQQRLGFEERQQALKFQRDSMEAQVNAAPDPATAALGKEIDRFFNTAASFGMMAAGGAMGGGGGVGGVGGGGGGGGSSMLMGGGRGGGLGASTYSPYSLGGYSFGDSSWLNNQVNAGSANGQKI